MIPGDRVEIPVHCDLWIRGARFGELRATKGSKGIVKMDNSRIKTLQEFDLADLKKVV